MRSLWVAIFLVACSTSNQSEKNTVAPDAGRWQLMEIDGRPADAGAEAWLEVDLAQSRLSGSTGCNRFFASFQGSAQDLRMGAVGGTKMLCPEPLMAQERRVYEILGAAQSMAVGADGMLQITGAKGHLRAKLKADDG